MARATNSLPLPVSPTISTAALLRATRSTICISLCINSLPLPVSPTISTAALLCATRSTICISLCMASLQTTASKPWIW